MEPKPKKDAESRKRTPREPKKTPPKHRMVKNTKSEQANLKQDHKHAKSWSEHKNDLTNESQSRPETHTENQKVNSTEVKGATPLCETERDDDRNGASEEDDPESEVKTKDQLESAETKENAGSHSENETRSNVQDTGPENNVEAHAEPGLKTEPDENKKPEVAEKEDGKVEKLDEQNEPRSARKGRGKAKQKTVKPDSDEEEFPPQKVRKHALVSFVS